MISAFFLFCTLKSFKGGRGVLDYFSHLICLFSYYLFLNLFLFLSDYIFNSILLTVPLCPNNITWDLEYLPFCIICSVVPLFAFSFLALSHYNLLLCGSLLAMENLVLTFKPS